MRARLVTPRVYAWMSCYTPRHRGRHYCGAGAGNLISEITLAMTHGLGLRKIASTIHPYPIQAEAIRRVGDLYSRTRLAPRIRALLKTLIKWRR